MKSANTIIDECRELLSKEDESNIELVNENIAKRAFIINKKYEKYAITQVEGFDVIYSNNEDVIKLWYIPL